MVLPSLASLKDLCCSHLAYLLWIRRDIANKDIIPLETIVSGDVQKLPLPEKLKPIVEKHLKPTGGHLLSFLELWLTKLPDETPQKQLIGHMLFDCLVLNADGLINQRRTAQTLLSRKVLHNVLAFRLACINFLETEVLKLWILVREDFLSDLSTLSDAVRSDPGRLEAAIVDYYKRTSERVEVLVWVGHCEYLEIKVGLREVPPLMGSKFELREASLNSAVRSGNVACFDYFKNFSGGAFKNGSLDRTKRILRLAVGNWQDSSFIFHFMLLNAEEKSALFREFPIEMVNQFLHWPLSRTFLQNTEVLWNLLPAVNKHRVFSEVFKALISENVVLQGDFTSLFPRSPSPTYCKEHLLLIWHALWRISSDDCKSAFLNLRIFPDFPDFQVLRDNGLSIGFEDSGLKQKLLALFLSNGGALLELYQKPTLQESLRSVMAKYLPADLRDEERRYIFLFETFETPLRKFQEIRDSGPSDLAEVD